MTCGSGPGYKNHEGVDQVEEFPVAMVGVYR
jgi:hypothetical protein